MPPSRRASEMKKVSPVPQRLISPPPPLLSCRARPPATRARCGCAPSCSRTCSPSATLFRRTPARCSSSGSCCSPPSPSCSRAPGSSGGSKNSGWKVSSWRSVSQGDNAQLGNFHCGKAKAAVYRRERGEERKALNRTTRSSPRRSVGRSAAFPSLAYLADWPPARGPASRPLQPAAPPPTSRRKCLCLQRERRRRRRSNQSMTICALSDGVPLLLLLLVPLSVGQSRNLFSPPLSPH